MARTGYYPITDKIVEKHDPARQEVLPGFETEFAARVRAQRRIDRLKKEDLFKTTGCTGVGKYAHQRKRLLRCYRGKDHCISPACHICMRNFRRGYISHGLAAFEDYQTVFFVTWVPEPRERDYRKFNPQALARRFMRLINERMAHVASKVLVWGCVESKFEETLGVLVPHVHAMMAGCTKRDIDLLVPRKDDPNRIIYRPLVVSEVELEDRPRLFSYCCKSYHDDQYDRSNRPPNLSERERRISARNRAQEMFDRHNHYKFTKCGAKYLKTRPRRLMNSGKMPTSNDHLHFLASLSIHSLPVLRGIKRKNLPKDLQWTNSDHLSFGRKFGRS